ncbi:MAG: FISUMP domain-containing protein [Flavobacteriaceae bacterium]
MKKLTLLFVFVQSLVFANNPVITLNGDSVVELYLNTYYDDPGATAYDEEDGDLSDSIVVTGTYNGSSVGSYVLAYSVTDSDGNETVKNRIINVVQEYREGFEISATHSSTDENGNGVLDVSDTILFSITLENTGNSFLGGYFNSYNLVNFNGNNLSLNQFQWGSYDLNVGTTLIYSAEYTISESTADSGGIEFSVTSIANQLTVTSNTLRIPFASTSDEIILDGQISANNNQIKKVADPTDILDAVNKRYVDQRTLEQTIPGQNIGDLLYWNGQNWQKLSAPQEQSTLRFCDGQLTWGVCKVDLFAVEDSERVQYDDFYFEVLLLPNGEFPLNIGAIISKTNQNPNEQDDTVLMSIKEPEIENDFRYPNDINFMSSQQFEFQRGETYYVKYFADNVNNLGRSYSDVVTVSTQFKDQNGNTINSKTYGNQEWSTQSANVTTYRDGTPIPEVTDPGEWANLTTGAWCYPNNQDQGTGKLYNWYAVAGIDDNDPNTPTKELAPEGWHVPTDAEWSTLENYLIDNGYNYDDTTTGNKIAKAMANDWGWSMDDSLGAVGTNQSSNNRSGFYAYPLGYRGYWEQGSFINIGNQALFWSSTSYNGVLAWYFRLSFNLEFSDLTADDSIWKQGGMQVRFVKD